MDRPPAFARPLRVAVLGAGAMGTLHARVVAELPEEFSLAGVYDPRREAAEAVADRWSVAAFASEEAAVAAADLVIVASPIDAHAASAHRALARGRHLLVEKPICATAAQGFALAESLRPGQRAFVGHSERFNPVVRALASLVDPRDVRIIRLRRTASRAASRPRSEHAALVSLGVHDIDLVRYLVGDPTTLARAPYVDHDRADLLLACGAGAVATVHVDRRAAVRERTLEIETEAALFSGDLLARTLTVRPHGGAESTCELVDEEALVAQAKALARSLRGAPNDQLANAMDGARALLLIEDATRLARHSEPSSLGPIAS